MYRTVISVVAWRLRPFKVVAFTRRLRPTPMFENVIVVDLPCRSDTRKTFVIRGASVWRSASAQVSDEHGVTTLAQMLSLLALQPALWKGMLAAVAPTKAFHKNRLHTQLKRLAEGGAMPTAARREATDGYWGAIDAEIRSDACGVDGAAAPDATRMAAARAAVDPAPPSPVTLPMAVIVRRSR